MSRVPGKRARYTTLPHLVVPDGTLEALKWLALMLMTGDHINKYLFNGTLPLLYEIGRLAMPLFAFTLGYNLARPSTLERGVYERTMTRLIVFGLAATPAFIALNGLVAGGWPLNVMFTLLAATATLYLIEKGGTGHKITAGAVFVIAGSLVEFLWPAMALCAAVWWYCKQPTWLALFLLLAATTALWFINSNLWALAALPILLGASRIDLRVPRLRWAFYAYYPLHLVALCLIRIPMSQAGYFFINET